MLTEGKEGLEEKFEQDLEEIDYLPHINQEVQIGKLRKKDGRRSYLVDSTEIFEVQEETLADKLREVLGIYDIRPSSISRPYQVLIEDEHGILEIVLDSKESTVEVYRMSYTLKSADKNPVDLDLVDRTVKIMKAYDLEFNSFYPVDENEVDGDDSSYVAINEEKPEFSTSKSTMFVDGKEVEIGNALLFDEGKLTFVRGLYQNNFGMDEDFNPVYSFNLLDTAPYEISKGKWDEGIEYLSRLATAMKEAMVKKDYMHE